MRLARPLLLTTMEEVVAHRARDRAAWREATAQVAAADAVVAAFAKASRFVGRAALALVPEEATRLRALGVTWSLDRWALDDFARAALLLRAAAALERTALHAVVDRCYRDGDTRERQAVLRALPFLPHPERFLAIALEACRSGLPPLFEAIACENPYPAAYFPAPGFNQMVVAALGAGVALDRVVSLGARVTPELVRLASDYASERRIAGRSVAADLGSITGGARTAAA